MTERHEWQGESRPERTPGAPGGESGRMAREKAGEMAEDVRHKGQDYLENQKRNAADSLHRLASALEDASRNLESDQSLFSGILRDSSRRLEQFAGTLRERDTENLIHQAQDFARRQPALVLGGTVAAGFLLSRVLKSSSHRPETEYISREKSEGNGGWQGREEPQSGLLGESASTMPSGETGGSRIITSPTEPETREEGEILLGGSEGIGSEDLTRTESSFSTEGEKKESAGGSVDQGEIPGYGTFPNVKEDKDAQH